MNKLLGFFLMSFGIILIIVSIIGLINAFNVFTRIEYTSENVSYTIGSIVIPLLLTVIGRWLFRKGKLISKG